MARDRASRPSCSRAPSPRQWGWWGLAAPSAVLVGVEGALAGRADEGAEASFAAGVAAADGLALVGGGKGGAGGGQQHAPAAAPAAAAVDGGECGGGLLGRAVVGGEIAPGASLTLEDVQSRHGVSRTLARDCVRTLESLGVVESRRRVGIVVRPRETWSALAPQVVRWQLDVDPHGPKLGALTELRAAIEPVAAAAAARAGSSGPSSRRTRRRDPPSR